MKYDQVFILLLLLLLLTSNCLSINDKDKQCSIRDTCLNSSSISPLIYGNEEFIQSRNCFCDSICQKYGDCCNQSKLINSNKYQCIDFLSPTLSEQSRAFARLSVWMRTKCLRVYLGSRSDIYCRNLNNQTFKDNPILFIPVTSIRTNITYRNYFCAYCNNATNSNIQIWEYKIYCRENQTNFNNINKEEQMNNIYNSTQNCTRTIIYPRIKEDYNQPSVFIRPCKNSFPSVCPLGTSTDLARNCSLSSTAYRYDIISKIIYSNPYCAECNKNNNSEITCLDPYPRSGISGALQQPPYPLSILFDPSLLNHYLNSDSNNISTTHMIYSFSYKCKQSNELYNLFLNKCSPITDLNKQIIMPLKCSYPVLTLEKSRRFNNGSLYLRSQSIFLTKDQYVSMNDYKIIFCSDQWKNIKITFPFYRNILSMICTIISLACLLIFMITFCLIPSLHNLPGKCLLFLSISIFLGQSIFLLTSDLIQYSSLCFISAILIHYFYLSSFFWLLIIAIHIHSTFNRETVRRKTTKTDNYHLLNSNIFVWCSTGIIIFIACLIQFTNIQSSFSPNYGDLFCSISKSNAMIVFFLLPIGCLLLIIIILFLKTILAIHRSHTIAKLANSSTLSNNHFVFIYARLASLMGLQWSLLIFALIFRQNWLWIIFEIINSIPGVFICLGFLCSQRLWSPIKQRITTKLTTKQEPSNSNTATSSLISRQPR
ncbi:unnamed protein product [Adineta steineri]|uniref:G-protein coupled receptors family 2 profile 2 domain-containing protein n=1 Tax=Adineta steineri TaxID=433720 RepID=A0A818QM40_9BILA|nr:unnamed protein product [Adineta steineri]